jgi:hypothetical protein
MIVLIFVHAVVLLWINLNHPIFDSDATNAYRWVGLAKEMYRQGGLEAEMPVRNPMFPSLIPLWANMFTMRWYDSLAALPWFLFYVALLVLSCDFVFRITGEIRNGLFYSCVLASIPILWLHVIRPGFSDLILCYFMACVLSLLFYSHHYQNRQYFMTSLVFMLGACMTKQEGLGWMLLIYAAYFLMYLYERRRIPEGRILIAEILVLGAGLSAFLLAKDSLQNLVEGRSVYLGILFHVQFDMDALGRLTERLFTWGTFGGYWYLFLVILAYLLIRAGSGLYRLICVQIVFLLGLMLLFLCATGNVQMTMSGTNPSRLLMHWLPLGGLVLAMLIKVEERIRA